MFQRNLPLVPYQGSEVKKKKEKYFSLGPVPEVKELYHTELADIVSSSRLPLSLKMREETILFTGSNITVPAGGLLTLHFIHRPTRVFAIDRDDKELFLPHCAFQLYDVLPINPVHDDKLYKCTEALINTKPLPRRVRVEEAHFSDFPGEAQEVGDIIEIDCIEKRPVPFDSQNVPEKCLIGTCNNVPVAFSESMNCASYSTMPSIDYVSLSEAVEQFPLPLRVRKADDRKFVMVLHRSEEEHHVIATTPTLKEVLSIPLSWAGKIDILENANLEKLFRTLLPPLYPLINTTQITREVGRRELLPNMKLVCKPMEKLLSQWCLTREGQAFVIEAGKCTVDNLQLRIEDLMEDKKRLQNEMTLYRDDDPLNIPLPLPRNQIAAPPIPPKPQTMKKPPPSPLTAHDIHSAAADEDEVGVYEEPMPIGPNKGKSVIKGTPQIEELKSLLQIKEIEVSRLKDKNKRLMTENKDLQTKSFSLVDQVRRLQQQLDKFDDDPNYDSLKTYQQIPGSSPIYSDGGNFREHFKNYDVDGIVTFLRAVKMEAYVDKFRDFQINGELLISLNETDMHEELGMPRIQAKRLFIEIKKRNK